MDALGKTQQSCNNLGKDSCPVLEITRETSEIQSSPCFLHRVWSLFNQRLALWHEHRALSTREATQRKLPTDIL